MDKIKISKKQLTSLEKLANKDLNTIKELTEVNVLERILEKKRISSAIFECLMNNDSEGVIEVIKIYLNALDKEKMSKEKHIPKSTFYSALKHKNPTIKTLAKIMHSARR